MSFSSLEDFLPERPARDKIVTTSLRFRPEVNDMLNEIAEEMGVTRTAVLNALVRQEHHKMFED